ncbi:uncharacterized protein HMPREF1541_08968 [Cyphellophora europaea CBS 101466]|uniref:NADP-dependent oxidoreductase domain-containing protein n=1 Tax=Cyphellophora europaea (strain CBS 101466) TaxID=1220924 RepID=W2RK19_CYPE1|nr:uncharacterized protein HMPREF1541_08968 [Cyphellophora europaea CBS 101466]ETN36690.1 hypothetical protein HMPREF1541_08968 [Cyphellophora europaea CBS 101466]
MATATIVDKPVGAIGYGLMGLTWTMTNPNLPPAAESYELMNLALAQGANFFNGGEIYSNADGRNSCDLLREFFTANPGAASKVVLSIKGGTKSATTMDPDGSEANARRTVDDSLAKLGGTKTIDVFQYARVDHSTPIEEVMGHLKKLVSEGKIGGVGLSEVRASTIERAAKVVPIAAVEIELSLWTTNTLRNGVAETCARLGIPIVAYAPLARGVLAGGAEKILEQLKQLPENDWRRHLPKFQDDVVQQNLRLTKEVEALAAKKGVKPGVIAINWVRLLSGRRMQVLDADGNEKTVTMPTVIPIPGTTNRERLVDNSTIVDLSEDEMKEIDAILEKNPVVSIIRLCFSSWSWPAHEI